MSILIKKQPNQSYKVTGQCEDTDTKFEGDFWEDDNGLVNNLSFEQKIDDEIKNDIVTLIEIKIREYQYGSR